MTFSIVAFDDQHLGVATASHWVAVGSLVPWAASGGGAIATQAFTEVEYGRHGLELLANGEQPDRALQQMITHDAGSSHRQVGMMSADGHMAFHTGSGCYPHTAVARGDNALALGNMLSNETVAPRMIADWEASSGPLAERLVSALRAGEEAGGDARGPLSAALIVVDRYGQNTDRTAPTIDVRIDEHTDPLGELGRLRHAQVAYNRVSVGAFSDSGSTDVELLRSELGGPADREARTWLAYELLGRGDENGADRLLSAQPELRALVESWHRLRGSKPV